MEIVSRATRTRKSATKLATVAAKLIMKVFNVYTNIMFRLRVIKESDHTQISHHHHLNKIQLEYLGLHGDLINRRRRIAKRTQRHNV